MGDRRSVAGFAGRKRGHQHHPKQMGDRLSNVPATEIIAALRRETLPHFTDDIFHRHTTATAVTSQPEQSTGSKEDVNKNILPKTENSKTTNSENLTTNLMEPIHPPTEVQMEIGTTEKQAAIEHIQESSALKSDDLKMESCDIKKATAATAAPVHVTSSSRKSKSHPSQESTATTPTTKKSSSHHTDKSTEQKRKRKREHKEQKANAASAVVPSIPKEERPPIEGAASDELQNEYFDENDPDAAEWCKLRCTSERTEVVAEREHRRQNRRCADYPGLAFGRSIFSSDTMMKFNIIRNELHNIMKTQLKRVGLLQRTKKLV